MTHFHHRHKGSFITAHVAGNLTPEQTEAMEQTVKALLAFCVGGLSGEDAPKWGRGNN